MPRSEQANQQIRETQRAKILDCARKVFALKGEGATMTDIAIAAGVSQGLAYRYFNSKEEIFNELVKRAVQSSSVAMQTTQHMPGSPGERVDFLVSKMLEGRRERPEFYQLITNASDAKTTPHEQRDLIRTLAIQYQTVLRQLIVEGQASGDIAEGDPDQLVMAVTACLDGLARLALRQPKQYEKHFPDPKIILRMLKA